MYGANRMPAEDELLREDRIAEFERDNARLTFERAVEDTVPEMRRRHP